MPPGSVYTIGTDVRRRGKLALFLLQTQMNARVGPHHPARQPVADDEGGASRPPTPTCKANLKNLGITRDLKSYDFSVQAINLNQAKEGAETAVAFFISLVSACWRSPCGTRLVVLGEMSVQGMLLKVAQPARAPAARARVPAPSTSWSRARTSATSPTCRTSVLNKLQVSFYTDPSNAAIRAMGLE